MFRRPVGPRVLSSAPAFPSCSPLHDRSPRPVRRAPRCADSRLCRAFECPAARSRSDYGRTGVDAGWRWHRQDRGFDRTIGTSHRNPPGLAERNPVRHLHQQGGARDARTRRPTYRGCSRGDAVAGHLPFDRREDAAAACRTRRPAEQLHHHRYRRSVTPVEAVDPAKRSRREALAGETTRWADRPLEEPRAEPR